MTKRIVLSVICLLLLAAGTAAAQTYVRPSKGALLSWYNASQGAASSTTTTPYDWTAFYSATITVTFAQANGTACACPLAAGRVQCMFTFPKFNIKGNNDKASPAFSNLLNYDGAGFMVFGNLDRDIGLIPAFNVATQYIKAEFRTGTYVDYAGNPVATPCFAKITATPLPFPYQMLVEGAGVTFDPSNRQINGPLPVITGGVVYDQSYADNLPFNIDIGSGALLVRQHTRPKLGQFSGEQVVQVAQYAKVCASNADCGNSGGFLNSCVAGFCSTTIVSEASGFPQSGVRLQNVGTNPAICAAGENASALSTSLYSFVLKADTAANAGNGGVLDIPFLYSEDQAKRRVYCAGNGGDTVILGMSY